jgi:hypothetical protein
MATVSVLRSARSVVEVCRCVATSDQVWRPYADLPKVFRPDTAAESFVVRTVEELHTVLNTPHENLVFIESIMDPTDAPQ